MKTHYLNFYDYYLQKHNLLFKTIHITNDGFLMTKEIQFNNNYREEGKPIFKIKNRNVFHEKYEKMFKELCGIGSGGFGRVCKVRNKFNDQLFAIKIIELKGK